MAGAPGPKGIIVLNVDRLQERARKFLQTAGHPSTCKFEALNAVRALRRMADGNAVMISDLRFAPKTWSPKADPFMRDRIRELEHNAEQAAVKMDLQEQVIRSLFAKVAALEADLAHLREAVAEPDLSLQPSPETRAELVATPEVGPAVDAGLVPLGPIVAKIAAKTRRKHLTTAAAHALAIPVVEMRAWFTLDTMPTALAHKLASLPAEALAGASRKRWSDAEVASMKMLVAQGLDNLAIALTLSKQFGRRIFEGAVARARSKLAMAEWGQRRVVGANYGAAYH